MIELAIVAAAGAGLGIVSSIAIWRSMARAADAIERERDQAVARTTAEGRLLAATLASDQWKARANEEAERADALAKLLDEAAGQLDPGGARQRLLAKWTRLHVPADAPAGSGAVPVPSGADAPGPDDVDLLRPGED